MKPAKTARSEAERQFLAHYDASRFDRLSVAADVALVTAGKGALHALLVRRTEHPFRGYWSLPGGFVRPDESLDDAAARVLANKANIKGIFLEQLYTFGAPDRDPRTRVITVAYYALTDTAKLARARPQLREQTFAAAESAECEWTEDSIRLSTLRIGWKGERGGPVDALDEKGESLALAFDHRDILGAVVKRLRGKLAYAPIGFELLPPRFTLRELQDIHESVLGRKLNKDSFRRRMLASGLIAATGKLEEDVDHRPAELYRFTSKPAH